MAINIIGNNLQQYGNNGFYESDPSTWGFGSDSFREITRQAFIKSEGNYSAKLKLLTAPLLVTNALLIKGKMQFAIPNTKYIARAKVKSVSDAPIADDDGELFIGNLFDLDLNIISQTRKTIAEVKVGFSTFYEIETRFTVNATKNFFDFNIYLFSGDKALQDGILNVDEFTIYEYEDVPEPDCDIEIDLVNSVVVNASAAGQTDGSIQVATTGTPASALEYSKDGGTTWQSSNQFTGLGYGIYEVVIRESNRTTCNDTKGFAINEGTPPFDFTTSVLPCSTLGANDGRIEVTVSGNPNNPVLFSKDGGLTFQASNIFEDLSAGDYLIVAKDNQGFLLAKIVNVNLLNTNFNSIFFSENLIPYERIQTSNANEENYKIFLKILTSSIANGFQNLNFIERMRQTLKPNENGKATFNLRPAFRNLFKAVPPVKNSPFEIIYDRMLLVKKQFGDIFNALNEPTSLTDGLVDLVIYGGLNKEKYPNVNFFKGYLTDEKKFLTWRPRVSYVDRTQEDYITYFSAINTTTQLKVRIKAYFDDGTDETATINQTDSSSELYGKMYQLPAGPVSSGATGVNPAKNLTQYDLWLEDQNNEVITEVMNFRLTTFKPSLTRYILFLNSVGGYDVVRLTGKTSISSEIEKQKVNKYLDFDYLSSDGEEKNTHSKSNQTFQYSSGMFKGKYAEYMAEYMQDLLNSKKAYDITNGERIPINIAGGTFRIKETADFKYYTRFEAKLAYTDSLYTPSSLPKLGE